MTYFFVLGRKFLFLAPLIFLMGWGFDLPFPGRIAQKFTYKIHSIELSRYYHNGWVADESLFQEVNSRTIHVAKNFTFASRTAYLHQYFAVLFDYSLTKRKFSLYDGAHVERTKERKSRMSHEITPSIFGIYWPLRVGLSYHWGVGKENKLMEKELETSLRPLDAISLHLQFFVDDIPKTALGLGGEYQFSFQPKPLFGDIAESYFHKVSLLAHIYFTYYVHFRFKYSWERSEKDFPFLRVGREDLLDGKKTGDELITKDTFSGYLKRRSRHYMEYLFIYHFVEEFSVSLSLFQLIYSNFESPIFGFSTSINLNFGAPGKKK